MLARVRAYQAGEDVQSKLLPGEKPRAADDRVNTTLYIGPEDLEKLKIIAAKERRRVNDLILEGIAHVLALRASDHGPLTSCIRRERSMG